MSLEMSINELHDANGLNYCFDSKAFIERLLDYKEENNIDLTNLDIEIGNKIDRSPRIIRKIRAYCDTHRKEDIPAIRNVKEISKLLTGDEYSFLHSSEIKQSNIGLTVKKERIKWFYAKMLDFICMLESSEHYNYIPETHEDGWKYFESYLLEIRKRIKIEFLGEDEIQKKLENITDELEMFFKSFSIPGVSQRWRDINPNINYFDTVYDFINENADMYNKIIKGEMLGCSFAVIPTPKDIMNRNKYFLQINEKNKKNNFQYTQDRIFQDECVRTLELVYKNDFPELFE